MLLRLKAAARVVIQMLQDYLQAVTVVVVVVAAILAVRLVAVRLIKVLRAVLLKVIVRRIVVVAAVARARSAWQVEHLATAVQA